MSARIHTTWKLVRPHARPRLPVIGLVVALSALSAAAQAGVMLLIEPIWDDVLFPATSAGAEEPSRLTAFFRTVSAWVTAIGGPDDRRAATLIAICSIAIALALVAGLAQWGQTWFARRVAFQMVVDLRVRLARRLMSLSMRYHNQRQFGDLLSRVSADVEIVLGGIDIAFRSLLLDPVMSLAALAALIYIEPLPALGMLVVLPIALWPVSRLATRVRKGSSKSLTSLGASVQALSQMFQGIRTVKSFGGEERELERYRELNQGYLRASMKMVRAVALTQAWTAFYAIAGVAVLVLAVGWAAIRFDLFQSGGDMTAFFLLASRFNNYVRSFARGLTRVEESVGASERIQDLLDQRADVTEREEPVRIDALGAGVRFENVTFRYADEDEPALREITLDIRPGETLALVGPSGAGKSTLVDLIARLIDPTEGRITVDGHDLRDLRLADWTTLYAMVGQHPFLFHSSIAENVGYARPDATREEIEQAARAADIHDFVASLPEGYATNVADMGTRLSGGQRQRITIARALLKGAPLLLLDEATSALDSESEAEVQRALERLMEDRTVVVIAHRLSTVRDADRIAVLENGRLVELGRHQELIAAGGTYARLHALQSGGPTREEQFSESPTS